MPKKTAPNPIDGGLVAVLQSHMKGESLTEASCALRKLASWLAGHDGVVVIMTNGHTGEVMTLRNVERTRVAEIAVQTVGDQVKVISGVCAEGCVDWGARIPPELAAACAPGRARRARFPHRQ